MVAGPDFPQLLVPQAFELVVHGFDLVVIDDLQFLDFVFEGFGFSE